MISTFCIYRLLAQVNASHHFSNKVVVRLWSDEIFTDCKQCSHRAGRMSCEMAPCGSSEAPAPPRPRQSSLCLRPADFQTLMMEKSLQHAFVPDIREGNEVQCNLIVFDKGLRDI